jgi:hypothetical protein
MTIATSALTITLPLVLKTDDYGRRWVLPDGLRLTGNFAHNRGATFRVTAFDREEDMTRWWGASNQVPAGAVGDLMACASVIAAHYGPDDYFYRLPVVNGQRFRTFLGLLELRDDWWLHDPYLVKVDL